MITGLSLALLFARMAAGVAGGSCVPAGVDPNRVPLAFDRNVIQGLLLAPDPNDPNDWHAPVGKWNRLGRWCDPEGDSIRLSILSAMDPGAGATIEGARWRLVGDLSPGLNIFVVQARDERPWGDSLASVWTILVWGDLPANRAPVLH